MVYINIIKQNNIEYKTRNAELGTRNAERRTRNAERRTRNAEHGTRNAERFLPRRSPDNQIRLNNLVRILTMGFTIYFIE